ncbi:MAG TPA: hypothetical protein VHK69_14745 [Chitinophagaceae bacterium]|jgi:hypothetical protein|nr:hypothetical protein [Chitinophagaceae bacterium]
MIRFLPCLVLILLCSCRPPRKAAALEPATAATDTSVYIPDSAWSTTSLEEVLQAFGEHRLQRIALVKGSSGCFHHRKEALVYERGTAGFSFTGLQQTDGSTTRWLHDYTPGRLPAGEIAALLDTLAAAGTRPLSGESLGIEAEDRRRFLAEVDRLERRGKTRKAGEYRSSWYLPRLKPPDFARLRQLPGWLDTAGTVSLNGRLFRSDRLISTSSQVFGLELENRSGEQLRLYQVRYGSLLDRPVWVVWSRGFRQELYHPEFARFLQLHAPEGFFSDLDDPALQLLFYLALGSGPGATE